MNKLLKLIFSLLDIEKNVRRHFSLHLSLKLFVLVVKLKLHHVRVIHFHPFLPSATIVINIMSALYLLPNMKNYASESISHELTQNTLRS